MLNNTSLSATVMPGGDFDGQIDYLEQFGSNNVSVTDLALVLVIDHPKMEV